MASGRHAEYRGMWLQIKVAFHAGFESRCFFKDLAGASWVAEFVIS
jgi:hypothetical protein